MDFSNKRGAFIENKNAKGYRGIRGGYGLHGLFPRIRSDSR